MYLHRVCVQHRADICDSKKHVYRRESSVHFHFQMLRAVSRPRAHQYIILRECKLFADNDTGLVHYASACYVCAISLLHQLRIEHSRSLSSLIMRSWWCGRVWQFTGTRHWACIAVSWFKCCLFYVFRRDVRWENVFRRRTVTNSWCEMELMRSRQFPAAGRQWLHTQCCAVLCCAELLCISAVSASSRHPVIPSSRHRGRRNLLSTCV